MAKLEVKDITENDIVIAVMGPSGSGKRTFIDIATGRGTGTISHLSQPYEAGIRTVRFPHPRDSRPIVFVNTPGFDDPNKSDVDIWIMIADWLEKTYKNGIRLAGIIYLHRISDNRMAGSPYKNLHIFMKLCGDSAAGDVIFTTTMWSRVLEEVGSRRQKELEDMHWKPMLDCGSTTARFLGTFDSAWSIVERFVKGPPAKPLLLQEEMVDQHRRLNETQAGIALYNGLQKSFADQKESARKLLEMVEGPNPAQLARELNSQYEEMQRELSKTSEQLQRMKIPFARRIILLTMLRASHARAVKSAKSRIAPSISTGISSQLYGKVEDIPSYEPATHSVDTPATPDAKKVHGTVRGREGPPKISPQLGIEPDTVYSHIGPYQTRCSDSASTSSLAETNIEHLAHGSDVWIPGDHDGRSESGYRGTSSYELSVVSIGEHAGSQEKDQQQLTFSQKDRCRGDDVDVLPQDEINSSEEKNPRGVDEAEQTAESVWLKEQSNCVLQINSGRGNDPINRKALLDGLLSRADRHPSPAVRDLTGHVEVDEEEQAAGGFAVIYRGCWKNDDGEHDVAVKVLYTRKRESDSVIRVNKELAREIRAWHRLDHPNIVKLLGVSYRHGCPAMVMYWHREGNARNYLARTDMSIAVKMTLIIDIARALTYLHDLTPPIVHGDLKGNNVLITDEGRAALSDFGLSQVVEERMGPTGLTTTTIAGSVAWQAPEVLRGDLDSNGKQNLTTASDVWSFACTAYELLTGKIPYYMSKRFMIGVDIIKGLKPQWEENGLAICQISDELRTLLDCCWSLDASKRPAMRDVLLQLENMGP